MSSIPATGLPRWRRGFSTAARWILSILVLCIIAQVFLAGVGLLGNGETGVYIDYHRIFVHSFELFPVLIAVFGFLGRDKALGTVGLVLFFLIGAQYALIGAEVAMVRALHVVNALAIFGLALVMAHKRPPIRRPGPPLGTFAPA